MFWKPLSKIKTKLKPKIKTKLKPKIKTKLKPKIITKLKQKINPKKPKHIKIHINTQTNQISFKSCLAICVLFLILAT